MTIKQRILSCLPSFPNMIDLAEISKRSGQPLWICRRVIMDAVQEGRAINQLRDRQDVFCRQLTILEDKR